ncbi:hypothetical protein NM208_g7161 [Fusarium decemcellulare]|uniref:Uncharacterized protein n=1 Tax=Fusarium decemcellulare TaxID=57161 RepID=A0ACC1SA66_9HYPO|nr:hypothetical protein NM208_g7161 [Fusarium decemcellulare]
MRLINAETLHLHEFHGEDIPPYAILSHTWGVEEVTFQDWRDHAAAAAKVGFAKIQGTSSAELTEAINSMFAYYQHSRVCFAYLSDVPTAGSVDRETVLWQVRGCRWFTRGWTLQELLAPEELVFHAADWSVIGWKHEPSLVTLISQITKVEEKYLTGQQKLYDACIAKRMSWLSTRKTTRIEDMAYCVLGIFDIIMPLLYGEGTKAFTRLQEEIIKTTNDHTIFCWTWTHSVPKDWTSFLAPSPGQFEGVGETRLQEINSVGGEISIFSMTNAGLSIKLPVMYALGSYFVVLQAGLSHDSRKDPKYACINVQGEKRGNLLYVSRAPYPLRPWYTSNDSEWRLQKRSLLVMNRLSGPWRDFSDELGANRDTYDAVLLPVFNSESLRSQWTYLHIVQQNVVSRAGKIGGFLLKAKAETPDTAIGVGAVGVSLKTSAGAEKNAYLFMGIKFHKRERYLVLDLVPEEDIVMPLSFSMRELKKTCLGD